MGEKTIEELGAQVQKELENLRAEKITLTRGNARLKGEKLKIEKEIEEIVSSRKGALKRLAKADEEIDSKFKELEAKESDTEQHCQEKNSELEAKEKSLKALDSRVKDREDKVRDALAQAKKAIEDKVYLTLAGVNKISSDLQDSIKRILEDIK